MIIIQVLIKLEFEFETYVPNQYLKMQLPPLEQGESTADEIWEFQKNLAAITTMVMGSDDEHNPLYLMQFDENGAK